MNIEIPKLPDFAVAAKARMPGITDVDIMKLYKAYTANLDGQPQPSVVPTPTPELQAPIKPLGINTTIPMPETPADARLVKPAVNQATEAELERIQGYQAKNDVFDPEGLKKANEDYTNRLRQNIINGGAGNSFAAISGAFGNRNAVTSQKEFNDNLAGIAQQETLGLKKLLAEQYDAGEKAATSITNRLNLSKKFDIDADKAKLDQTKLKAELIPMLQNADVAIQMAQPSSAISMSARVLLKKQLEQAGISSTDVATMVPETLTAIQAAPIAANLGLTMKQITEKTDQLLKGAQTKGAEQGARKTGTEADMGEAVVGSRTTTEGGTRKLTAPADETQTSISVGGYSESPSTGAQARSTAAAAADIDAKKSKQNFTTFVKPRINKVKSMLTETKTGKGSVIKAAIGDDDLAYIISMLADIDAASPGTFAPDIAAELRKARQQPGYTGNLRASLPPKILNRMLDDIVASNEAYQAETTKDQQKPPSERFKNKVTTREEYDKMKPGEAYIAPDGKRYIKGE